MKALLLAAGRGTRISRYLNGNPKCMVELGKGQKLIEYTVELLKNKRISEIAIVTGYRHQVIENLLFGSDVRFFYNPFYDITNSIASMWFAKDFLCDDDILIMNADVFAESSIYDQLLSCDESPVLAFDSSRKEEADYKFYCPNGVIEKYGKELTGDDITGEYVGFAVLKKAYLRKFTNRLTEMINMQKHDLWWENVLYELSEKEDIYVKDVNGKFWAEVDYIEDYNRIKDYVGRNY